ncbi:MAG: hypothetical protein UU77_C0052G0001, partial [candidate division WWE3 bacterium GW2011_GWC1_41_7]
QTVSFWIKPNSNTESILKLSDTEYISASSGTLSATGFDTPAIYVNGTTSTTLTANVWQHVQVTTATPITADAVALGLANSAYLTGELDEVKLYNYVRSTQNRIEDFNAGHPAPGSPIASAIGHWRFDEGTDNQCSGGVKDACNTGSAGTNLDAEQTGMAIPATSTSGWTTEGRFGMALNFDYSNDKVTVIDNSYLDVNQHTLSAWVRFRSFGALSEPDNIIAGKYDAGASQRSYILFADSTGHVKYRTSSDGASSGTVDSTSTTALSTDTWYYVAGTFDGTNQNLYINGILEDTDTQASVFSGNADFVIGATSPSSRFTAARIDDVKLYNFSLSPEQIILDYNQAKSTQMGTFSTQSDGVTGSLSSSREYCVPGDTASCNPPVGHWKFDEHTGVYAYDSTGNSNTGTLGGDGAGDDIPEWYYGKSGSALMFDGDDNVNAGTASIVEPTSALTISFWFKASSQDAYNRFISHGASNRGYEVFMYPSSADSRIEFNLGPDSVEKGVISNAGIAYNDNKWHNFSGTWDGTTMIMYIDGVKQSNVNSTATGTLSYLGNLTVGQSENGTSPYTGLLEDVRIYNYARTPAQVAWDYNRGNPLAHWKFDECAGSTSYDSAPKSDDASSTYDGTIYPGDTSGDNDTVGTCASGTTTEMWNDGTTGKRNGSLGFDGTNDYVSMGDVLDQTTNDFSISAWVKRGDTSSWTIVTSKGGTNEPSYFFGVRDTSDVLRFIIRDSDSETIANSTSTITDTNWHYITVVADRDSNATFYIDGKPAGTANISSESGTLANNDDFEVGRSRDQLSHSYGQIDEIKIYNYTLTPLQIVNDYNTGAVYFGPETGSAE